MAHPGGNPRSSCPVLLLAVLLVVTLFIPTAVVAQDEGEMQETEIGEERKESGFHHLVFFLGATDKELDDPQFTTGLDYAYRLAPPVGLVAVVDNPRADFREGVFAAGFSVYPLGESFIVLAPGIELKENEDTEILFRLGVGYNFIIAGGPFTIGPSLNFDFVEGETVYVYGLIFGVELGR